MILSYLTKSKGTRDKNKVGMTSACVGLWVCTSLANLFAHCVEPSAHLFVVFVDSLAIPTSPYIENVFVSCTCISDAQLLEEIRDIKVMIPKTGQSMIKGLLQARGVNSSSA